MYEIIINGNKTITLNEKQFTFLKLIGQLGFLNFSQLTLLWSTINKTYVSFSHSMLRRWINNYHLLKKHPVIPSQKKRSSNLSRPVYHLSSFGARALKNNNIDYISLEQLNYNSHNEECNEVTIQALFQATFDIDLVNNLKQRPINPSLKNLIASSEFDLNKLDLRPFSRQVNNYKNYPFVPDQMISFFTQGHHKCEVMIELDNKTENDVIQMQKVFNYINYSYLHPNKKIMMVIAITDGSLPTYRVPRYSMPYLKVNNLLSKFKTYTIEYHGQKYSLVDLYRRVPNLTITIAGVKEAHVDIADFINDKNCISFSIAELNELANEITRKYNQKVIFYPNKKIQTNHLDYLNVQGKTLGKLIYHSDPEICQPVKIGYEHTLDTYLDLHTFIPKNYIYCFPTRIRQLLVPAISTYKNNPQHSIISPKQRMIIQPILEDNVNPKWLLQLLFAKEHYYRYLYSFFTSGAISASDTAHYGKLTYINSRAYRIVNSYLQQAHVQLNNNSPRPYQTLHNIAIKTNSAKEFAKQLNPQDIPLEVINSIFRQIPIKAFSSPYYPTSSSHTSLVPSNYLYLPNHPDPKKRIKIAF